MVNSGYAREPRRRLGPDERRRQLIDATVAVVSRRGYRNTSVAVIASEAGVSKGLVWHYFADSDDLMEQTARSTLVTLREVVARDLDLSAAVPQIIRAAIRRAAALRDTHGPQLRALQEIVQNLRRPDGTRRLGLIDYEETYALQAKLFQRGQDEGSLLRFDTRYMAVTYQGAVDTMLDYLDSHPGTDVDAYATTVADILLSGMAAGPVTRTLTTVLDRVGNNSLIPDDLAIDQAGDLGAVTSTPSPPSLPAPAGSPNGG